MIRNIDIVENWSKTHPVIELTEQQKTAIRGRIAEGYLWVARDDSEIFVDFGSCKPERKGSVYMMSGKYESTKCELYGFVTFENSPLYLPDLLGGEE